MITVKVTVFSGDGRGFLGGGVAACSYASLELILDLQRQERHVQLPATGSYL